jgi:hypothetical protein
LTSDTVTPINSITIGADNGVCLSNGTGIDCLGNGIVTYTVSANLGQTRTACIEIYPADDSPGRPGLLTADYPGFGGSPNCHTLAITQASR